VYAGADQLCVRAASGTATCGRRTIAPAKPLQRVDPGSGCGLREGQRLDARSFDRGEAAADPPIATDIVETISAGGIHCGRRRSGRISCVKAGPEVLRSGDVVHDRRGRDVPLSDAVQLVRGGALVDSPLLAGGDAIGCAVRRTGEVACWPMGQAFELLLGEELLRSARRRHRRRPPAPRRRRARARRRRAQRRLLPHVRPHPRRRGVVLGPPRGPPRAAALARGVHPGRRSAGALRPAGPIRTRRTCP
jgi:hypothetical protein